MSGMEYPFLPRPYTVLNRPASFSVFWNGRSFERSEIVLGRSYTPPTTRSAFQRGDRWRSDEAARIFQPRWSRRWTHKWTLFTYDEPLWPYWQDRCLSQSRLLSAIFMLAWWVTSDSAALSHFCRTRCRTWCCTQCTQAPLCLVYWWCLQTKMVFHLLMHWNAAVR